jgi:hypothetical protein
MSVLKVPDLRAVMSAFVDGGAVEGMLVIGLDGRRRPCGLAVNRRHRALSFIKVWELRALADELDASALVIAVFPAGNGGAPSEHERRVFADVRARAHRAQVELHDCIVVRGETSWSLRELSVVDLDQHDAESAG